MAGFIDEKHLRKCWDCGTTNEHESRIVPGVLCPKCGSQDTRAIRADHKPKATPGCVMANDETRAAGNFKERFSYPKDATMRVVRQLEGELDEARAELARLRAEVAAAREVEAGAKFAGTSLVDWLQSEADRQDRITDELLTGELPDGQRNCRVPFQQFFAMAYRKIAELIENTAAPDLLAEVRRLRAANAELEAWKRGALSVMDELDTQAVGKLLGVPLGQPIYAAIEPGIRRLIEANAELAEALRLSLDAMDAIDSCLSQIGVGYFPIAEHKRKSAERAGEAALACHDAGKGE